MWADERREILLTTSGRRSCKLRNLTCYNLKGKTTRPYLRVGVLHLNLRNIDFRNVISSIISQNPRERMCSV